MTNTGAFSHINSTLSLLAKLKIQNCSQSDKAAFPTDGLIFFVYFRGEVGGEIVGGDGGTGGLPSRLREEKVGMSGLPTDITLRLPEAVGGEGRMWRGRQGGTSKALVAA